MVEVTGSSPVLPTTPEKPRTTVRGFFISYDWGAFNTIIL